MAISGPETKHDDAAEQLAKEIDELFNVDPHGHFVQIALLYREQMRAKTQEERALLEKQRLELEEQVSVEIEQRMWEHRTKRM